MIKKNKRTLEWAISFWMGVGLMSVINIWKIVYTQSSLPYSWIMFGVSIIMIIISVFLIRRTKK